MSVLHVFRDGLSRASRAPAMLAGLLLVTFLMALPLGLALRGALASHMGASLAAGAMAEVADYDWWQEFASGATGIGETFTPGIIGFAAVLENLSSIADSNRPAPQVTGIVAAYLLVWTFLLGGILDRLARMRPTRTHGFFAASGVFFFRFLRLAVPAALLYWLLFGPIHGLLFETLYGRVTADTTVERNAFAIRAALYLVFGALVVFVNLVFDYAKVRAVVEDRRSMTGALFAALRFIGRNWKRVFGLYALNAGLFVLVLAVWAVVAPGAGRAGPAMWLAFLLVQLYVAARLWVKLVFYASEISLFQSALAHAGYTAAPLPEWPDSPAAEAIRLPKEPGLQSGPGAG